MAEGIQWKAIEYFNNAIVCQLIEEKLPKVIHLHKKSGVDFLS